MAPPRKPDHIKRLEGNPGKRRLRGGDRINIKAPAERPAWVTGCAAEIWGDIAAAAPHIRATDSLLLAAFCTAVADHRTAVERLEAEGHVLRPPGPRGKPFANPWGAVARDAVKMIETLGARLGMTPAARKHIQATPAAPDASKFAGMIGVPTDD